MAKPETPKQPKRTKKAEVAREADAAISKAKNPDAPKKKMGRPSIYSTHIANVICIRIAEGESLRQILRDEGMPAQSAVYEWLLKHPDFAEKYTRAREEQADTLADEIIDIADEQPEVVAVIDKKTGALIEHKLDGAFLQWQKNRIEARKWTAMKLKPKKYGDKLELSGNAENPLVVEAQSEAKQLFSALLENMELSKAKR